MIQEEVDSSESLSYKAKRDYKLIRMALDQKDQKAYGELMGNYRDSIYFMILKMVSNKDDADDLTIEAFGKAFNKLNSYAPRYAFSTWLFKIAINNCIDHIRKKRLHLLSIDDPIEYDSDYDYTHNIKAIQLDPEEKFIRDQKVQLMRLMLNKLSYKYRLMIELRFFEEKSYEEISLELGIPLGTVKAQLFRAKEILQELMRGSRGLLGIENEVIS